MTDQGVRDEFDPRCGEDYYTRPRIVEFDEDDEQACLRDREEIARRLAYEQKLRAHPCPSDPEHPGEFE